MKIKLEWTPRGGTLQIRSRFEDGGQWTVQASVDAQRGRIAFDRSDDGEAEVVQARFGGGRWKSLGLVYYEDARLTL